MSKTISYLKIVIPLGSATICAGIAGFLFYKLFWEDDDETDKCENVENLEVIDTTKAEIKVPAHAVGVIIGRSGSNVKEVQKITSTIINLSTSGGDERICIIRGKEENVEKAKEIILKIIEDMPEIVVEELLIPEYAIGRIIGRGGETIRSLQCLTGARISIPAKGENEEFCDDTSTNVLCKISLRGTADQIEAAKRSVYQKLKEEDEMRKRIQDSAANMSQRSKSRHAENSETETLNSVSPAKKSSSTLPLCNFTSKKFGEVFVSAIHTPCHFWVQVVGSKTVELNHLVERMTEFYDNEVNDELHILDEVRPGDIVAARFPADNMWYRGRVCEPLSTNEEDVHTVFFVDFGDTDEVKVEDIRELRTNFLQLSFQAVECYLADIDAKSADSDDSYDAFERLTCAYQWKPMKVRVMRYTQEGSDTIPCVQLIDANGPEEIDIAKQLVELNLAKWEEEIELNGKQEFSDTVESSS